MMVRFLFIFINIYTFSASAQERLPGVFTYQGRAYQTDGTTALTGPATFLVQIRSSNSNCLLYQESHAGIDLTASNGFFALNIGDGTSKSGLDLTSAFSNTNQPKATLGGTCGGVYTPTNQEARVLRITVNSVQLDDQYIYSVPKALVADSLNGYTYNQFVQHLTTTQRDALTSMVNGTTIYNITTGRFNRYNGSSWTEAFGATSVGGGSSIYKGKMSGNDWLELRSILGTNGITVTQNTNDITLSIDPTYTQRRVTGTCSAGNFITAINQDGTVSCAADATGGGGTVLTDGITIGGDGTSGSKLAVIPGGIDIATLAGTIALTQLPTCGDDQILKMNGTTWNCEADGGSGGGGLAAVATDATLDGDGTSGDPLKVVESNLDLADIGGDLDLATQVTGVLPVANGGTGASSLTGEGILVMNSTGTQASSVTCGPNEILQWSGAAWACAALPTDSNTTYSAGNGLSLSGTIFSINTTDIATCTNTTNQKIVWDSSNNRLVCATDAGASGGLSSTLNSGQVYVGDSGNTAVARTLTGDVHISNTGVTTIQNNAVETAMIVDDAVTADKIADGAIDLASKLAAGLCIDGQILKKVGGVWTCAADAGGMSSVSVSAPLTGDGVGNPLSVTVDGTSVVVNGSNQLSVGSIGTTHITDGSVTFAKLAVDASCDPGEVLKISAGGTTWECATDATGTALPAMTDAQIIVSNNTTPVAVAMSGDVAINNAGVTTIQNNAVETTMIVDDAVTAAKLADGAIDTVAKIGDLGCGDGQILKWSSAGAGAWTCQNDAGAGGGSENTSAINLGVGAEVFKAQNIDELQFRKLASGNGVTVTQNANDISFVVNESQLDLANIGGDLDLATQVTGVLPVANGGTGASSLTGEGILVMNSTGTQASSVTCGPNEILQWSGAAWACAALPTDSNTTYSAGNGLSLSGTTFSINTTDIATCTNTTNQKIVWDSSNNRLVCATDATGTALPAMTDAQIIVSNGATPVAVAMSGDVAINNAGATTIQPNAVETAMIADNQVTPAKIESGGNNKVLVTNGSGVVAWDDLSNISGTTYTAGTGLDLTGTVFSIENGGVGTTQLADGSVSLVKLAPGTAANQVLLYNGTSWARSEVAECGADQVLKYTVSDGFTCVNDIGAGGGTESTSVANVGTGVGKVYKNMSGTQINMRSIASGSTKLSVTNGTDDVSLDVVEANLNLANIGGDLDLVTQVTGSLPLANLEKCNGTEMLQMNGLGAWDCVPAPLDANTTYSAGAGLDLTGTTFSIEAAGVITTMIGDDQVTADKIADGAIDATTKLANTLCGNGDVLKKVGGVWTCAPDATGTALPAMTDAQIIVSNGTTPTAVAMSGDVAINNAGATTIQPNAVETAMIADNQVTPAKIESGGNNKVLVTNGSGVVAWDDLSNISGTTYTAGTGLDLTGTVFSIENGGVGTTQLADGSVSLAKLAPGTAANQVLLYNGTSWTRSEVAECGADQVLKYTVSDGFTCVNDIGAGGGTESTSVANVGTGVGKIYKNMSGTQINMRSIASGSTKLSVTNGTDDVSLDVVEANLNLANIGGDLDLATQVTGVLPVANGGTGASSLTGEGILVMNSTGTQASSVTCGPNEILQWSGAAWACAALPTDSNTTYSAGNGLSLSGTTFSINTTDIATCTNTTNQKIVWDSSNNRLVCATDADGGLTSVSVNHPLTGNGTSGSPIGVNVDAASIIVNGSNQLSVGAITSSHITDGTIATADLGNSQVTYAKIQNVSANNRLLGRATAGVGAVEEITLGTGLSLAGTTLNVSGTSPVGSSLTSANIWVGNASNQAAAVAMSGDVHISNTGATTIQPNAVETTMIVDDAVTAAKLADGAIDATTKLANTLCDNGDVLKKVAGVWSCAADNAGTGDITDVVAGSGLTGGSTSGSATVNVGAGHGITVNADDIAINTTSIATCTNTTTQKIIWDSTNNRLVCATDATGADNDTTYTAGTGLDLTGTEFSIADGGVGSTQLADGAIDSLEKFGLSAASCDAGQVLQWTIPGWTCVDLPSTSGMVSGSGTQYAIPRWNTTTTMGDSAISTNAANTMVTVNASLSVSDGYSINLGSSGNRIWIDGTEMTFASEEVDTFSITAGGASVSGIFQISDGQNYIKYPRMTTANRNTMSSTWNTNHDGRMWYNSTTDKLEYWDGTQTRTIATEEDGYLTSAITSLNGLTGATQTFATPGTSGTAPNWSSVGTAHTLNIPLASATSVTRGLISKAEYDSFNSKVGGSGNTNNIPKFTAAGTVGNSTLIDNGAAVLGTLPLRLANGSAAAPSYSFSGDTNTGMYLGGADVLSFSTGGSERLNLNSFGAQVTGILSVSGSTMNLSSQQFLRVGSGGSNFIGFRSGLSDSNVYQTGVGDNTLTEVGASSSGNTAVGSYALAYLGASSSGNTALGNMVMGANVAYDSATAFVGSQNIAVGRYAMSYRNVGGTGNTAVGYQAMDGQGTATSNYNIALGHNAMASNWAGTNTDNIAIGRNAMRWSLNGAVDNIAIGAMVLDALTTGDYNTGIGSSSLSGINTGSSNTGLGYQALKVATSSSDNVALGRDTLSSMTTHTGGQVAVGYGAMSNFTSGTYKNVAVGYNSLKASSSSGVVAVGSNSAQNTNATYSNDIYVGFGAGTLGSEPATSSNNVVLGYQSMGNLDLLGGTYSNNTIIGHLSGGYSNIFGSEFSGGDSITNNVLIGYNNRFNSQGAGPYAGNVIIGNSNVHTGSNKLIIDTTAAAGPLISGDFSTNRLGIGRAPSTYNFEVEGTVGKTSAGTAWNVISDGRLKEDVRPYEYGLDEILKLRTVRYKYKENNPAGMDASLQHTGFIAQEVMTVIPDAVTMRPEGYYDLNVDPIHWAAINAIQELNGKCEMSKSQMDRLDTRMQSAERRIASLEEKNAKLERELEEIKKLLKIK